MAAWDDPAVRTARLSFRIFMALYLLAAAGVFLIVVHGLWREVLAAWPK